MDPRQHYRNRAALPVEELEKYAGQHVAWNLEGTAIVASGRSELEVFEAARAKGYRLGQLVFSSVPFEDEIHLGGAWGPPLDEEDGAP